ncbi:MAG: substrate-binding domain-containing protein, partial [Candidatus Hydrogenedentes bacterium]|nr:substrate-binding domain-containing protein [Candidatus Hydrogenedentota bacterium]
QNTWMNLMEEYRKEKYPTMVNLSDGPKGSEEDQALATQVATDSLKAYPEMNGLFALTSVSLPGAAEALRKSNASQRVFLTGLATPNAMRQYVKDGTVKKFALWNCEDLGYLTVYAAVAAVKGELNPGATEITAGHIGAAKITGSEILLGDPLVFDANNIDQYNF